MVILMRTDHTPNSPPVRSVVVLARLVRWKGWIKRIKRSTGGILKQNAHQSFVGSFVAIGYRVHALYDDGRLTHRNSHFQFLVVAIILHVLHAAEDQVFPRLEIVGFRRLSFSSRVEIALLQRQFPSR